MEMIEIKDISGNVILSTPINTGSKKRYTLMKEDCIIVRFSLYNPITFKIGTFIDDSEIGMYELTEVYNPTYNTSTGAYDYELRMNSYYYKWKNKIFKYTPESGGREASWSLTASLDVHMGVFLRNLSALGYTYKGQAFTFSIDSTVENSAKPVTYENTNMLDALSRMAEAWGCEWWVTDNVIHFGRCEYGTAVDFEIGKNVEDMPSSGNRSTYATRVYAFGSTRNLPTDYRPVETGAVVNGVVQKRLMLPEDTPYIDAYPDMPTEQAVEQIVVFDDVYPKTDGNISSVSTYESTVNNEDGTQVTETFYRFKDNGITFSKDYILEGEELHVIFQSGSLNGMDFGVMFNPKNDPEKLDGGSWNPDAQLWEIVANENYGRKLPDDVLKPKAGDKYVLYGWDSTKIAELGLVDEAEQELKRKAEKYVEKSKIDPNTYQCRMMSDYMYGLDDDGNQDPNYAKKFDIGDRINLVNAAFFDTGSRQSRIIGYEYNLDKPWDSPVFSVGETASYSRISSLEEKVDSLTFKGQTYTGVGGSGVYIIGTNDTTPASNRNVYSAYRSQQEFLNKRKDDRTPFKLNVGDKLTAEKGIQIGKSYISGMTGGGGFFDEDANGEIESLTLRRFLEVPELRYNRADIVLGDKWRSPGAGIIESVEPDYDSEGNLLRSGTVTLKLQDGEIGAVAVDDICMGYFHDFETPANNAVSDMDDSRGNRMFAGFCTIYFRIDEILDAGTNKRFRYVLRGVSERWKHSFHPCEALHFVAYGNLTNKERQSSAYETRTYRRFLTGVNDWEFTEGMIAMQDGNLSNLNIFGLDMTGYSAYLNNIYMTGTIEQFQNEPVRIEIDTQGDNFLAYGESMDITCKVFKGWDDITDTVTRWTIRRDSGDTADDEAWNIRHKDFNGSITIHNTKEISDLGNNSVSVISTLFTITATNETESAQAVLTI